MSDIDIVLDAQVMPEKPTWEDLVSVWATASQVVLIEEFRRAKILYTTLSLWGKSGLIDFAKEVGFERSSAYDRVRLWRYYGKRIEAGDHEIVQRIMDGQLDISHWLASTYDPEPITALNEAQDQGLSVRAMIARGHERKDRKQEREAEERGKTVEVMEADEDVDDRSAGISLDVNAVLCEHCGGIMHGVKRI